MEDDSLHCETHALKIQNLEHDMKNVKHSLYGVDGKMGIVTMIGILWRLHIIWPTMFLGMLIGSGLTVLVTLTIKHF